MVPSISTHFEHLKVSLSFVPFSKRRARCPHKTGERKSVLNILLQLIRMSPPVYKNILHTGIGEKFKRILNQGCIRKRQKTLNKP